MSLHYRYGAAAKFYPAKTSTLPPGWDSPPLHAVFSSQVIIHILQQEFHASFPLLINYWKEEKNGLFQVSSSAKKL